jgi:TrmH family RNA methyltransferase
MTRLVDVPLKPYRKDFGYSYALGVFPTLELLQHRPDAALKVLIHSHGARNAGVEKIRDLCDALGVRVEQQDKAVDKLSQRGDTYAVGVFEKVEPPLDPAANHLVLVSPSDMGNLGTIVRTMLGFGLRDLAIIPPAADLFDPRTVRASMGALFQVSAAHFPAFDAYAAAFAGHALYPFMTDGRARLDALTFAPPFALIFGSESAGLPASYRDVGTSVTIPQLDTVDSLNLSIAVGIGLYQSMKGAIHG